MSQVTQMLFFGLPSGAAAVRRFQYARPEPSSQWHSCCLCWAAGSGMPSSYLLFELSCSEHYHLPC